MDPNFINSEVFELNAIIAILVFGLIIFLGLILYRKTKAKKTLASFRKSAVRYLSEARQPGLAVENVFEKLWYMSLSLIALNKLGDPKWRLEDFETNEKEIFNLLGISALDDIRNLFRQGVKSAEDIICIIERCREIPTAS